MAKDFSNVNTDRVYNTITEATADPETSTRKDRRTYEGQEAAEFLNSGRTSGRKGLKLSRINMAFTPDVYEYIKTMSRVSGLTMTAFINKALKEHMENHKETYNKALEFRNSLGD